MADTDFLLTLSDRVNTRVKNALAKIRKAEYGYEAWVSDTVGFWVDDVADSVKSQVGDVCIVLIDFLGGTGHRNSPEISVPNPNNAVLSELVQVGGTAKLPGGPGGNVILAKPPGTNPGTVQIQLVGTPGNPGEQYVGWLRDGSKLLAQVVVLT